MTTGNPTNTNNSTARPNFFILLGINPNSPWNQATFEQILKDKRREWSSQSSSVGAKVLAARRNLDLIKDITIVMSDETLRNKEATLALVELSAGKKQRLDELEQQLDFINQRSSIEQKDLDKLIDDFKDILTAQEIQQRIKVTVNATGTATATATASINSQLDPTLAKTISDLLQTLNMASLYEFLGRSDRTAITELVKAAEQTYQEQVKRLPKNADVTARTDLAGQAKTIFSSESMRKKYDETLRQNSLNLLLKELEKAMSYSPDNIVEEGQTQHFLEKAQITGWSEQEARGKLLEYAARRKWMVIIPKSIDPNAKKLLCDCKTLNDSTLKYCTTCKQPLYIDCPDCGEKATCEHRNCGHCGFPVGNRYLTENYLSIARSQLKANNLSAAQQEVNEATDAWQPKKEDELKRRINILKAQIETELQRIAQKQKVTSDQLEKFITQKFFFAARQFLATADAQLLPNFNPRSTFVNAQITQAQDLLKQSRVAGVSYDERIELCREALLLCADYKDARDLLKTMPPSPPTQLQIRKRSDVVSLTWAASTTRGATYIIVRKSGAQPNTVQDGSVVDTVTGLAYEDTKPEIGVPLYYAVYAEYEKVVSAQPAKLSGPIILTKGLAKEKVNVQVDNHQVTLSWSEPPPNLSSVLIIRKEQSAPSSRQDGQRVGEVDKLQSGFIDRGVQNERQYYYGLYCLFKDQEGNILTSAATIVAATPETPPTAIDHININVSSNEGTHDVQLSWTRPRKGNAAVIKSPQPLKKQGQIITESEANQLGKRLEDRPDGVKDTLTGSTAVFYTPIVIFQTMAYIGISERCALLDNIRDLHHQNLGSAIRLTWKWPDKCEKVRILYSTQDLPELGTPHTTSVEVSHTEYFLSGHYDIRGAKSEDYYISLTALIQVGSDVVEANPLEITARITSRMVISYEIKNSSWLQPRRKLHIMARTPGTLPAMVIIGKRDRLPSTKSDGDELYRLEPVIIHGKGTIIELAVQEFPPNTYGKLFLEDDDLYDIVKINHPSSEKMRLS